MPGDAMRSYTHGCHAVSCLVMPTAGSYTLSITAAMRSYALCCPLRRVLHTLKQTSASEQAAAQASKSQSRARRFEAKLAKDSNFQSTKQLTPINQPTWRWEGANNKNQSAHAFLVEEDVDDVSLNGTWQQKPFWKERGKTQKPNNKPAKAIIPNHICANPQGTLEPKCPRHDAAANFVPLTNK